jgi:hypothetical protein
MAVRGLTIMEIEPTGPMPPYAFVPGGPWPHPTRSPSGQSAAREVETPAAPIEGDDWRRSPEFVRGIALFNSGYYWEAHEAWERLWHAHGRAGATAALLKGLIKLAAAGVKVREGQPRGVATHAARAAGLFEGVRRDAGDRKLGLDLATLAGHARRVAAAPPADPGPLGARVTRVFDFDLQPGSLDPGSPPVPSPLAGEG